MDSGNTEDELRLLPIYPGYVGGLYVLVDYSHP
jgi:hypothetical protein